LVGEVFVQSLFFGGVLGGLLGFLNVLSIVVFREIAMVLLRVWFWVWSKTMARVG
jgi:hypothetical protein